MLLMPSMQSKSCGAGCVAESCTVLCQTGKAKPKWGEKSLNQNANHLYINMSKIPALKRADGNHISLNWQCIKTLLKIIREVQTTKGTLLLANWKAAPTSQDMTDFNPLTRQCASHASPRQESLPGLGPVAAQLPRGPQ